MKKNFNLSMFLALCLCAAGNIIASAPLNKGGKLLMPTGHGYERAMAELGIDDTQASQACPSDIQIQPNRPSMPTASTRKRSKRGKVKKWKYDVEADNKEVANTLKGLNARLREEEVGIMGKIQRTQVINTLTDNLQSEEYKKEIIRLMPLLPKYSKYKDAVNAAAYTLEYGLPPANKTTSGVISGLQSVQDFIKNQRKECDTTFDNRYAALKASSTDDKNKQSEIAHERIIYADCTEKYDNSIKILSTAIDQLTINEANNPKNR